jgi:acetyl esterase
VVAHAAHLFARARYAMPDAHPARHDLLLEEDVPYVATHRGRRTRERHHLLDIYTPTKTRGPLPVVLYVHGGAFMMLSKDTHRVMGIKIARKGYLVFNINYRQGPRHRFPEPLEDAAAALLWVQARAASYGGDPTRIAIAGESAGGNLVTALAVAASTRRPEPYARRVFDAQPAIRAVIATYPYLDFAGVDRHLEDPRYTAWTRRLIRGAALAYLGPDYAKVAPRAPLASPLVLLEEHARRPNGAKEGSPFERPLPPFFTGAGTKDPLLGQARRLKAALDALGVPCEFLVHPGEIHGYDVMMWRPAARDRWAKLHAFLRRHLARA